MAGLRGEDLERTYGVAGNGGRQREQRQRMQIWVCEPSRGRQQVRGT